MPTLPNRPFLGEQRMPTNMSTHLLRQPPHARGTTDVVKHEHETTCNDVRPHPKHGGDCICWQTNSGKAICERNHNAPAARYTWCTCDATPVAASGPLPEENSLESQETVAPRAPTMMRAPPPSSHGASARRTGHSDSYNWNCHGNHVKMELPWQLIP